MDAIRPEGSPLELVPLGESSADAAASQSDLRMTAADEFLAAATKEYQDGQIDQTLWARASAQSGNDQDLVIAAYLRARATALQLEKRDRRLARRARRAARQEIKDRKAESDPQPVTPPPVDVGVRLRFAQPKPRHLAAAAAAVLIVIAAAWLIVSPRQRESTAPSTYTAPPSNKGTPPAGRAVAAQTAAESPNRAVADRNSGKSFDATVQQLKDAGNWNMVVLYASKWTRDEPDNAAAWKELSIGYANLHQFDDAAVAAAKAVELSPGDALLWRNLGHLNVTLERLPEAAGAFDKALTLSPDNADALCEAAVVAQRMGRMQDAEAIAKRVDPLLGRCPGMMDGESVAVVVRPAAASKPASKVRP